MSFLRGWIGEQKTNLKLWLSLDPKLYFRINNLIIPSKSGTTQFDHIVISPFGIFIIETKNKKGWIYGSVNEPNWTQVLYNQKHTFQNPLRQTFHQMKVLSEFLDLEEDYIRTIVYFAGKCRFKTVLPSNVIRSRLGRYIKSFRSIILSDKEFFEIIEKLYLFKANSTLTRRDHIKSLKKRHSSEMHCPRCGSRLVLRTARRGANAGSQFLGCEAFPKCRFSKNI